MTNDRANPFEALSTFRPKADGPRQTVDRAQIAQLGEESGFPSREPPTSKAARSGPSELQGARPRRRYTTGRDRQINIKASAETIERLHRIADELMLPLGAVLERAIATLEEATKGTPDRIAPTRTTLK